MPGLLRALVVAAIVLFGASTADAQVFKPRGKTPSTKAAPGAKKGAPAAAVSKTPTRATGAVTTRRVVTKPAAEADTAPAPAKAPAKGKAKGKSKGKEDVVVVDDDDDDGVQIKDD